MTGIELLPSDRLDHGVPATSGAPVAKLHPTAGLSAAELIAGPCALPVAPLAMPPQVIEPRRSVLQWLAALLRRQDQASPPADLLT